MNIHLMPVQHPRLELKLGHLVYPENKLWKNTMWATPLQQNG
jgi:hypothetical protein